jgi:4-azaleucine resistance transporter AzlC
LSAAAPALPPSARREFAAGLAAISPLLLGAVPFGLIYGALAVAAGIPPLLAIAISSIVFAGSAQFMIAKLVAAATPGVLIVLSVCIINLRHALYSAALAARLAHLPARWKILLAYLLTDEAYAASLRRLEAGGDAACRHWFLLGAGLGMWLVWQLSCIAGVVLGGRVPAAWSLDFAGTLTFIAIVVPLLRDRATFAAMAVAGAVAVLAFGLPYKLFIIVAALAGMAAGVALDHQRLPAREGA